MPLLFKSLGRRARHLTNLLRISRTHLTSFLVLIAHPKTETSSYCLGGLFLLPARSDAGLRRRVLYLWMRKGDPMGRFDERTVIVTGGGGGIGGALCRGFAAEGAAVAVLDRDVEAAGKVATGLNAVGSAAIAVGCDITERSSVEAAVAQVTTELGSIDVLVNNAGWDLFVPFLDTDPDDWSRLIDINLIGALHMHHAVLPGMLERGGGRVVNISSDAARVGSSGEAVYAACKAGVVAFSKTLAREHARHGVTFNVVCPGPIDTALLATVTNAAANPEKLREAFRRAIPMGRLGQPDDLVGAVLFFASEQASFVTGQVLSVSGGLTMAG
jgi:2-hydroxycyclohexanecarboxyl-CoA dehydrogenase